MVAVAVGGCDKRGGGGGGRGPSAYEYSRSGSVDSIGGDLEGRLAARGGGGNSSYSSIGSASGGGYVQPLPPPQILPPRNHDHPRIDPTNPFR